MFSESPCLYLKQPVDDVKPLRVTHHFWGGYHCPVSTELQHGFASIISHPVATSQQCSKPYCSAHWKKLTIMASDMCIHQSTYLSISSWFRFIAFHHPHIIPISSPYHPLNLHIEKFPCLAEKSSSTPFLIGFMWGGGNMWQPCVQIRLHLQHSSHDQHPKRSPKSQASATVVSSFICSCDSCCCRCVITQSAC